MFAINYMMQDLVGVFLAVFLFLFVLVIPGYVIGFLLDIFNFKKRQSFVQVGIALLLSLSISPILFFLTYRVISCNFTLLVLFGLAITFFIIMLRTRGFQLLFKEIKCNKFAKSGILISILWIIFSALLLVDLQWGNRLYYNIVAYDYSTRASVINAITRTGVPPLNPGYFPGTPQPLTQLYYFWYVLCSLIDQIGGEFVDARTSLIASVIWTGLALFSVIAFYTNLRNPTDNSESIWRKAWVGIGLLLVSGLDVFPSTFYTLFPKLLTGRVIEGDIEHWNEQVTAWIGAIAWTPHHVASMLSCLLAWFLIESSQNDKLLRQIVTALIAGVAFASAFGLSVWTTFIFVIFWGVWGILRLVQRESIFNLWIMFLPWLVAGVAILPFAVDLFSSTGTSSTMGQFPLALNVRVFYPLEIITVYSPSWERVLLYLLALPLNYFLEFGFFFLVGILWFHFCLVKQLKKNSFALLEISLFLTTTILVTFVRSTVIVNNDFGWRGWMFGQFILIFWGVDSIQFLWNRSAPAYIIIFEKPRSIKKIRTFLSVLITIGVLTSFYNAFLLRTWPIIVDTGIAGFPRLISPDNHLGERTLAARDAYEYVENNLPLNSILQFDPRFTFDRPSGLYRTRSTVISYHTSYGISENIYDSLVEGVGSIFDDENDNWPTLDTACKRYHIDILILRDIDPIWSNLRILKSERTPIYENQYFALFKCNNVIS